MSANISTNLFFNRSTASMQKLQAQFDRLNEQVSTGKKLLAPSDDSVGYQRLQVINRANADGTQDAANVKLAQSTLQQAGSSLSQMTERLQRASELVIQGRTGTNSDTAKAAIATELEGILESVIALANGKDARGMPLFGGKDDGAAVARGAGGTLTFAEGKAAAMPIGDGQSVEVVVNAKDFLAVKDSEDLGSAIAAMVAALRAGETIPESAADTLATVADQVTATQASLGAREARVDLQAAQLKSAADDRELARADIEDADPTETIVQLQKTMTILQATQASFSKLSSLSLFDYLR
ncbi:MULTISPECIES: flagellar hook-associated protein FlgL [unclassified Sphingomonas]|uniref:flagellar hook-associated protein FlgL n=1 Tax=unclassified Sphingomonas TaxID=196159 RepID=UPI001D12E762|nr:MULTISPECIES: flagellar hook-associated protein FlgL [unclassified Sphingomonas]MCC2979976.1 flagellar hook-associated protein FlgL [Sphingomonas sp. IC4-52]MCD2314738.1 flagellar hook-associated protein FlgL [Sphingomonas sp. IC-11]